jgi:hypothetical protein
MYLEDITDDATEYDPLEYNTYHYNYRTITNQPQSQQQSLPQSQQQSQQQGDVFILEVNKNISPRMKQQINRIIAMISHQYNQLGFVDLTIWSNYYYFQNTYIPECCFNSWCCCNYNPNYYISNDIQGYGQCCGISVIKENVFWIGYLVCCIPYMICAPIGIPLCVVDCWYRKWNGYSRSGMLESVGNKMLEWCVCGWWEKYCYVNIMDDEMDKIFEVVKIMYSGILEVDIQKYSKYNYGIVITGQSSKNNNY